MSFFSSVMRRVACISAKDEKNNYLMFFSFFLQEISESYAERALETSQNVGVASAT